MIVRDGADWVLTAEQWLPVSRAELFPFFADAANLERITPDTISFRMITPKPIEMKPGTLIDYQLRVRGIPLRWRSEIVAWEPPHRFADLQVRGPYALWHHEHRFEERDGGTACIDEVRYRPPGGPLAPLVNRFFIQNDVRKIFSHRRAKLEELFDRRAG